MTALLAAACAGVAAWFSIGILAVSDRGEFIRVGLLPPLWCLPVLVLACVGGAKVARLSTTTASPLFCSLLLLLPWIPGHVPAAFLIWTGRAAMGVWACIGVAMLAARQRRPGPFRPGAAWSIDPHRAPRVAAAIACALYIGSAWWMAGILPGGDEPHYLIITQSLLNDGDLQIENNHARGDYREYFPGDLRPDFLRRGTNGQIYSIHAPGLSVVIAPAFALRGYHGVIVFLSAVAALGGAMMWFAAYRMTGSAGAAWFAWATWALTVPMFFQAFSVFPDGLGSTVVLFAALPLLVSTIEIPAIWSGVALALLPWLHTRFALIAGVLGACFVFRLIGSAEGRKRLPAFLGVPILSAVAWFGFFRLVYGTVNPAAPYGDYTQTAAANILNGLPALWFDQQYGILPYAPVYGFCLIGMVALARTRPRLAIELSAAALAYLLSSSAYHMWWGGSSAPARFAVPVLPLLVLPGAWLWHKASHNATRAVGFGLLVVSIAITAVVVLADGGQLAYNFRDGFSRVAEWASPLVDLPQALPSFFRQTSGGATLRALIWIAPLVLVWAILRLSDVKRGLSMALPLGFACAAMCSATVVWSMDRVPGPTPDTSQLNLLEHADPRWRPRGVDLTRLLAAPSDVLVSNLLISTPRRRPAPPVRTLLLVPGVLPAGSYALRVSEPSRAGGSARLVIGRNARPITSWDLGGDARDGEVRFDLPVDVGSIVVEGDDQAVREAGALALRPVQLLAPADRLTNRYARRVERYGPGLAYFLDDGAFIEEPGFWVRGGSDARFVATRATAGATIQLFLRNAPVPNHVTIDVDGAARTLELQPGEERLLPLTLGPRGSAMVHVESDAGFRPSAVDARSTDHRYLGVWVEFRP
jgi:hypothetical protein